MNGNAAAERVAIESISAAADGVVSHHATFGIVATGAGARVDATLVDAGQVGQAVRVDDAFGSTVGYTTVHVGLAAAARLLANNLALRVGAAGRRDARVGSLDDDRLLRPHRDGLAANKWIASHATLAVADGIVVDDAAHCVLAADARTGISAALGDARHVGTALRVGDALGAAVGWQADESRLTGTRRQAVDVAADAVGSARRRRATVGDDRFDGTRLDGNDSAGQAGVSSVAFDATAHRQVIDDTTFGVETADTRAWVDAAVVDAAAIARAFRVLDAFRPTADGGIAQIVGWADAHGVLTLLFALGTRTTRRRLARVAWSGRRDFRNDGDDGRTANERIARQSVGTRTNRIVVSYSADSTDAADARTRVLALLVDAGQAWCAVGANGAFGTARVTEVAGQTRTDGLAADGTTLGVRTAR